MAETYVPIYLDWTEVTEELNDQEKGRLIDAIVLYKAGGDWQDRIKGNERYLFPAFRKQMDRYDANPHGIYCGSHHWNWKGGITPENQRERSSSRYAQWRKAVFERDAYTCQECGKRGGKLNAHHICSWASFPAMRFEISNGITLCEKCHKRKHKGGGNRAESDHKRINQTQSGD